MLQASGFDVVAFDPFSFQQNDLAAPEVDVGRGQVADALVVLEMIVVGDEVADPLLEITGYAVVFEKNAVLERLMPTLDLALRLRMQWCPAIMIHPFSSSRSARSQAM
jgi:hypothetical protein